MSPEEYEGRNRESKLNKEKEWISIQKITILWVPTADQARQYVAKGFEAIECAMGEESVVGPLKMDHHGDYSDLEGVAIRAYRDYFGARKSDPMFVVTGAADADATFAIAALCGLLPHPSRASEFEKAPAPVKAAGTRDLTTLVQLINQVDVAPIGIRLEETEEGILILLWKQLVSGVSDEASFYAGIDRWRMLLGRPPKALLEATRAEEANRVALASVAEIVQIDDSVAVVKSKVQGFDVWYQKAPVIVAFVETTGGITIGCSDDETAEKLFGPGGLNNVFVNLDPKKGWGGRKTIGGSPRGQKFSMDQAIEVAKKVASMVISK